MSDAVGACERYHGIISRRYNGCGVVSPRLHRSGMLSPRRGYYCCMSTYRLASRATHAKNIAASACARSTAVACASLLSACLALSPRICASLRIVSYRLSHVSPTPFLPLHIYSSLQSLLPDPEIISLVKIRLPPTLRKHLSPCQSACLAYHILRTLPKHHWCWFSPGGRLCRSRVRRGIGPPPTTPLVRIQDTRF